MSRMSRRTTAVGAAFLAGVFALAACSSDSGSGTPPSSASGGGGATVRFLITSAGDADVKLQQDVVKPWEDRTGNKVEVVAATDINQELSKGFADGTAPDLFFADSGIYGTYAKEGNLLAYGDQLDMKDDFYPALVQTFTYGGKFYCAPKDFTTLALVINTDMWTQAGLATTDVPTNWAQLESVAQKLTSGSVKGLVVGDTINSVGAFMRQAGGWIVTADQSRVTADTPTNLVGLTEVQKLLKSGSTAYPKTIGAASGAEALGKGTAAMAIEGTTFKNVARSLNPQLKWTAIELPAGPASKGTLLLTQCYGISAKSTNQAAAIDLVKFLSTSEPAMQLARGLGVMPSIRSAQQAYLSEFPSDKAFASGAQYATPPVTIPGMEVALADFDTQLAGLPDADPKAMLEKLQKDGDAILQKQ